MPELKWLGANMDRMAIKKTKTGAVPVALRIDCVSQAANNGISNRRLGSSEILSMIDTEKSAVRKTHTDAPHLTAEDSGTLLRIVRAASRVKRHYDLFDLLQGEVQRVIPHEILIAAWGDYRETGLTIDVVSALQGVRTREVFGCGIERLLHALFARWVANGRRPMLLTDTDAEPITKSLSTCGSCAVTNNQCALHFAMPRMRSVLVHGVHNKRDNIDSLYLALNSTSKVRTHDIADYHFAVDSLIEQIDVGFRKVAALKPCTAQAGENGQSKSDLLSTRERETIKWISEGKTNAEIAQILGISAFTVKNHVRRIFRKLGAANRTGAVAKYNGELAAARMNPR